MKRFEVVLADVALSDIVGIDAWLTEQEGVEAADRVVEALFTSIESLTSYPDRGSVLPEFEGIVFPLYRQHIERGYRIVYRCTDDRVYVLAILHQRRDLQSAIRTRLIDT